MPLLIQPVVLPHEVQRQVHNVDIASAYSLEFYEATWKQAKVADVADMTETIKNRIGDSRQFFDYGFTHLTNTLVTKGRGAPTLLLTLWGEKLKMQFDTAKLINAVDANEVAAMVLNTHILPDIIGNMRSILRRHFAATCGAKFRRMPLMGKCIDCGSALIQTVTGGQLKNTLALQLTCANNTKLTIICAELNQ